VEVAVGTGVSVGVKVATAAVGDETAVASGVDRDEIAVDPDVGCTVGTTSVITLETEVATFSSSKVDGTKTASLGGFIQYLTVLYTSRE
jgi:hypothetical protein